MRGECADNTRKVRVALTRILRAFSAYSPRILRAFSAHSPRARKMRGKYAENAREYAWFPPGLKFVGLLLWWPKQMETSTLWWWLSVFLSIVLENRNVNAIKSKTMRFAESAESWNTLVLENYLDFWLFPQIPFIFLVIHLKERSVCVGKSHGRSQCQFRHYNKTAQKKDPRLETVHSGK